MLLAICKVVSHSWLRKEMLCSEMVKSLRDFLNPK